MKNQILSKYTAFLGVEKGNDEMKSAINQLKRKKINQATKTNSLPQPSIPQASFPSSSYNNLSYSSHKGKGGKGVGGKGKVGTKRTAMKRYARCKIEGITKSDIRRLARRGGVSRISSFIYDDIRIFLKRFL